jgi:hypothetical protein
MLHLGSEMGTPAKRLFPTLRKRARAVCLSRGPNLGAPIFPCWCCLSSCLSPNDVFVLLCPALPLSPGLYPSRSPPPRPGDLQRDSSRGPDLLLPAPWPSPPAPRSLSSFIALLLSCPSPRAAASGGREACRTLSPLFKVSRLVSQEGARHGHLVSTLPCPPWITMSYPGRAVGWGQA